MCPRPLHPSHPVGGAFEAGLSLPTEVFQTELLEIAKRRQTIGVEQAVDSRTQAEQRAFEHEVANLGASTPSAKLGLAGLALSGGGIRSATFNLGVLQAFCKRGLFGRFDYLSTVSGGSYIGGMISSLLVDQIGRAHV